MRKNTIATKAVAKNNVTVNNKASKNIAKEEKNMDTKKATTATKKSTKKVAYFEGCETLEDVRAKFVALTQKKLTEAARAEVMTQFLASYEALKETHKRMDGKVYKATNTELTGQGYADFIGILRKLKGVTLEVVGTWLWATGDTKDSRDVLKENGFRYAPKKQAWYFTEQPSKKGNHNNDRTMDDLRAAWGSKVIATGKASA